MQRSLKVVNLGRLSYGQALTKQKDHARLILNSLNDGPRQQQMNYLFLVEHEPVYTVGIRSRQSNPDGEEEARLRKLGADFQKTDRGGLITFHGPGQLVAYPVLYLKDFKLTMKCYVHSLEQCIIDLCHGFHLDAERSSDTGVWIGQNKIAAIGVHGSRFVTTHGVALNCDIDLGWFDHIVPCGIADKGVTSLSQETGSKVSLIDATAPFLKCFSEVFDCDINQGNGT